MSRIASGSGQGRTPPGARPEENVLITGRRSAGVTFVDDDVTFGPLRQACHRWDRAVEQRRLGVEISGCRLAQRVPTRTARRSEEER